MAPTLGLTAIGGMTLGFPIGFPLLDLVAWCNIRVPLELVLNGLGSFKIEHPQLSGPLGTCMNLVQ